MAFISGVLLVDAPGSALNNQGAQPGERTDNVIAVKQIRTRGGIYPYVSAQAVRYWIRTTLERSPETGWKAAPVHREAKIAYTDADPLEWWDDDLFGYMRAPSKKTGDRGEPAAGTPVSTEITRASPFRVSPLISIAPVQVVGDFGTMSRHEGNPVPHEHQFYRTVLKGLFSIDLSSAGTFTYVDRTGFRNLDDPRRAKCEGGGLEHLEDRKAYRLPAPDRARRVTALLRGMGMMAGGAKLALHYTDVTPVVLLAMVTRGGNNPLHYVVGADGAGNVRVDIEALREVVGVWGDQIESPLYAGWVHGFHDGERERLERALDEIAGDTSLREPPLAVQTGHPREVLDALAGALAAPEARAWME